MLYFCVRNAQKNNSSVFNTVQKAFDPSIPSLSFKTLGGHLLGHYDSPPPFLNNVKECNIGIFGHPFLSGALWMIHFLQTKLAHHQVQQRVATEVLERWISFCWLTVNSFQSLQSSKFCNCGFNAFCWGGRGRHRPNTSTQKELERDRAELERRGDWTEKGKLTKTPTCERGRN